LSSEQRSVPNQPEKRGTKKKHKSMLELHHRGKRGEGTNRRRERKRERLVQCNLEHRE